MKQISVAGNGLLIFLNAVLGYCDIFKDIKPKKERVQFLEIELNRQIELLAKLKKEIETLERQLADLNQQLTAALAEKAKLQAELEQAERRLVSSFKEKPLNSGPPAKNITLKSHFYRAGSIIL